MKRSWLACSLLLGCLGSTAAVLPVPESGAAPAVAPLRKLIVVARVGRALAGPDTLVMVASWQNPTGDGRGALDSLRVRFVGIPDGPLWGAGDTSFVYQPPPFPTTQTRRQIIPGTAYGTTSWPVRAEATTYRRGLTAGPVVSPTVTVTLVDAPPPAVGGFTFQAVKVP